MNTKTSKKSGLSRAKSRGFTLIELLVAVFVFFILFLIIMAFVNLAVGQTKSLHTKMLTTSLRHTMDTISQKMNSANDFADIGSNDIYGFKVNGGILGIANEVAGSTQCTFIGEKQDKTSPPNYYRIYMKVNNCSGQWPTTTDLDQPITDTSVAIDPPNADPSLAGLVFSGTLTWTPASLDVPYLKIIIRAKDKDPKYTNDNQITLQTSYMIDYLTIQRLKSL